jgi:DNA-binding beta-propeller fold protein YncE
MLTTTVQGRTWNFSHAIGHLNIAGEGFLFPYSVVTTDSGFMYVLNRAPDPKEGDGNKRTQPSFKRIAKWKLDHEFISDFGKNDIMWPVSLAVDEKGFLYCTDEIKNKVLKYDSEDQKILEWGVEGSGKGQFSKPAGIASDLGGHLYVVDAGNNRIQKFTNDGEFIHSWGEFGSDFGQLNDPWGITVDSQGFVYVADWGNNRVQKFTGGGEWLQNFGVSFPDDLRLDHPSDVAVDSEGDVYVTDWGNEKVQIFDSDGEILTSLYGDATELSRSALNFLETNPDYYKAFKRAKDKSMLGVFMRPTSISITRDDRIIICDSSRQRLQVYDKEKGYLEPTYNL